MSTTPFSPPAPTGKGRLARLPDAWEGLLWPRLFAAPGLALRSGRIGLGVVIVALTALIARIPDLWLRGVEGPAAMFGRLAPDAIHKIVAGVTGLNHLTLGEGLADLFYSIPRQIAVACPWSTAVILPLIIAVWSIGGGAISRMAAVEFSLHRHTPWTKGLSFALSRGWSLAGSLIAPLIIAGALVLLTALAGAALLGVPWLQVVGGAAYFLFLLLGLLTVIALVGYALGKSLLVPAVACEGADSIDSVQRSYAYVLARPVRVVVYTLILIVQSVILTIIAAAIAQAVVEVAAWASTAFVGEGTRLAVRAAAARVDVAADASKSQVLTAGFVGFWSIVPRVIVLAIMVSFYFCGSTVMYLLLRQACDGQDPSDLWSPGMIPGVIEEDDDAGDDDED